jgi:hypothetical protein
MGGPGSGGKVKVYPAELVEHIRELYFDRNMSQAEVGAELGVHQLTVSRIMRRVGLVARPAVAREKSFGADHNGWKGDNAGYAACHKRVYVLRGLPLLCEVCGASGGTSRGYQWANLTGNYADPYDYSRMCLSCHRRFDIRRRMETGERTMLSRHIGVTVEVDDQPLSRSASLHAIETC